MRWVLWPPQILDGDTATLWFAGKEFFRDQKMGDRVRNGTVAACGGARRVLLGAVEKSRREARAGRVGGPNHCGARITHARAAAPVADDAGHNSVRTLPCVCVAATQRSPK